MPEVTFRTNKANAKEKAIEPLLVSFPQGVGAPPENASETEVEDKLSIGVFQHERHSKKRIVVAQNHKVDFVGSNFGSERSALKPTRYVVVAYNKTTKEAEVLNNRPVNQYLYALKQSMMDEGAEDDTPVAHDRASAIARKRTLIETFGSQKKRREVVARDMSKLDSSRVEAASSLTSMLQEQMGAADGLSGEEAQIAMRRGFLPHFDPTATEVEQAYPLDKLLSLEQRSAISKTVSQWAKDYKSASSLKALRADGTIGSYVEHQLQQLAGQNLEKKDIKHKIRLLVSAQYMMSFYRVGKFIKGTPEELSVTLGDAPKAVVDMFLQTFTTREVRSGKVQYTKSKRDTDKLMMYLLVTCLHIQDFAVQAISVSQLASDLSTPMNSFGIYFSELGCKISGRDMSKVYRLVVPLKFPDMSKRKSRR